MRLLRYCLLMLFVLFCQPAIAADQRVDLLFVVDDLVLENHGDAEVNRSILHWVEIANTIFASTSTTLEYRVVNVAATGNSERSERFAAGEKSSTITYEMMDSLHQQLPSRELSLMTQYGADIVVLVIEADRPLSVLGNAQGNQVATLGYTNTNEADVLLAHELGHLLGMVHPEDSQCSAESRSIMCDGVTAFSDYQSPYLSTEEASLIAKAVAGEAAVESDWGTLIGGGGVRPPMETLAVVVAERLDVRAEGDDTWVEGRIALQDASGNAAALETDSSVVVYSRAVGLEEGVEYELDLTGRVIFMAGETEKRVTLHLFPTTTSEQVRTVYVGARYGDKLDTSAMPEFNYELSATPAEQGPDQLQGPASSGSGGGGALNLVSWLLLAGAVWSTRRGRGQRRRLRGAGDRVTAS
ncbi:M12 family metallo-peptidase [Ferrimonas gelatinilytica]|uniref:Peptidase M12B domain-containing protein n=1 Tax=Ferrimonas gelatinilytica TaxID=1255257 RepID=A0ABP9RUK1_9GAMM